MNRSTTTKHRQHLGGAQTSGTSLLLPGAGGAFATTTTVAAAATRRSCYAEGVLKDTQLVGVVLLCLGVGALLLKDATPTMHTLLGLGLLVAAILAWNWDDAMRWVHPPVQQKQEGGSNGGSGDVSKGGSKGGSNGGDLESGGSGGRSLHQTRAGGFMLTAPMPAMRGVSLADMLPRAPSAGSAVKEH